MLSISNDLLHWAGDLPSRSVKSIHLIVLHSTEEPELRDARRIAEEGSSQAAAHYYIDRDGSIVQWVPDDRIANHAYGHNRESIGIELVNRGRSPNHFSSTSQTPIEPFPKSQLASLTMLLEDLKSRYPWIADLARHSDLDHRVRPAEDKPDVLVRRRIDPGPQFPWGETMERWRSLCET
jgi:N-acetylmuramoyl-L-alanine amidase